MNKFKIVSPFIENISIISKQEITNRICTIHINNKQQIKIPLLISISFSSVFARQLLYDISVNEFYVNDSSLDNISSEFLEKIKKIFNLEEIQFDNEEEIKQLALFGKIIGNQEFMTPLMNFTKEYETNLNEENVISLIKLKYSFNLPFNQMETEISHISKNFNLFIDKLIGLGKDIKYFSIIESIIKHDNFEINSEDDLLTFIIKLCNENKVYELLFENVWLEYCSVDSISKFVEYINSNICNDNHIKSIIKCINRRLIQENLPMNLSIDVKRYSFVTYDYDDNNPLNGILRQEYLKDNVEMKASGTSYANVYDLLKNDESANFHTTDSPNSWIEGSLKTKKPFIITKYVIRGNMHNGPRHLKSWKLEGKQKSDGKWVLLDSHQNEIFRKLLLRTFPVSCNVKLDAVRLTQTERNTSNDNILLINSFDIFGKVYN